MEVQNKYKNIKNRVDNFKTRDHFLGIVWIILVISLVIICIDLVNSSVF